MRIPHCFQKLSSSRLLILGTFCEKLKKPKTFDFSNRNAFNMSQSRVSMPRTEIACIVLYADKQIQD